MLTFGIDHGSQRPVKKRTTVQKLDVLQRNSFRTATSEDQSYRVLFHSRNDKAQRTERNSRAIFSNKKCIYHGTEGSCFPLVPASRHSTILHEIAAETSNGALTAAHRSNVSRSETHVEFGIMRSASDAHLQNAFLIEQIITDESHLKKKKKKKS